MRLPMCIRRYQNHQILYKIKYVFFLIPSMRIRIYIMSINIVITEMYENSVLFGLNSKFKVIVYIIILCTNEPII